MILEDVCTVIESKLIDKLGRHVKLYLDKGLIFDGVLEDVDIPHDGGVIKKEGKTITFRLTNVCVIEELDA